MSRIFLCTFVLIFSVTANAGAQAGKPTLMVGAQIVTVLQDPATVARPQASEPSTALTVGSVPGGVIVSQTLPGDRLVSASVVTHTGASRWRSDVGGGIPAPNPQNEAGLAAEKSASPAAEGKSPSIIVLRIVAVDA